MLKCSGGGVDMLLAFDPMPYLTKQWLAKVRTVLVMLQQAQHFEDAGCNKTHPRMTPLSILFAPLALLQAQVYWGGYDVTLVAPSKAASDNGSNRPMADVV